MKEAATIQLNGLTASPPQVLGGIRLVPLIRSSIREDLRLAKRAYAEEHAVVEMERGLYYTSYVPHGLVANWTTDGGAVFGTQLADSKSTKEGYRCPFTTARGLRKMVRREGKGQLRFLPLHVAMEGLLALHFGGPDIAWSEYSTRVKRQGLSPRCEQTATGSDISGLEDALRLFEIHKHQVGMLLFVADELASAFVLPHPDDYAALHHTLLTDFYGELLQHYAIRARENELRPESISADSIESLADLRRAVDELRQHWGALAASMATSLCERSIERERIYRFKPFTLDRFVTDLDPKSVNFIGESIVDDYGSLQYLKTYRLSAAQTRRAYLLKQLALSGWSLEACAASLNCSKAELVLRMENAGFGYMLHQHVLDQARAYMRRL